MRVRPAILMMSCLAAICAAQAPEPVEPGLGLSFDAMFEPVQSHWRGGGERIEPVLLLPAESHGTEAGSGYAWGGGALDGGELDAWLAEDDDALDGLSVGRSTALRDGGIDGARSAMGGEHLAGYAEPSGEFDLYDISMRIGSIGTKRIGMDFLTGFRAVQARVGYTHSERTESGDMQTTLDLARGVVTIPVVGTGVHWQPTDRLRFSGSAATHTVSDSATFYDLSAEASIQLRPNIGLVAGYQYVRSAMEVRAVPAELDEEGLFARIQIRF